MLKNSARNCRLALSLILWIGKFLNREKSKLTSPGPRRMPTPELPKPVACAGQFPSGRGMQFGLLGLKGSSSPMTGGVVKQLVLMYLVNLEVSEPLLTYWPGVQVPESSARSVTEP